MTDAQIKSVALFFYYHSFDEQKTLVLTARTLMLVRKKLKGIVGTPDLNAIMIEASQKISQKKEGKVLATPAESGENKIFQLPDGLAIDALKSLKTQISPEEFSCLLWSKVLGVSDESIALGLATSLGTVRHRTATGLQALGQLVSSESGHG